MWHYCWTQVVHNISRLRHWQVLNLWRPWWYTPEIRKWKQIRKMPKDFFYPWKWPCSALQSHSTISTSRTFLKPHCNLTNTNFAFPAALTPAPLVWLSPSSLRLELVCYLSSSENVHIQVKLFAVEKAGGMSYTKDLWSTFSCCTVLETEKIPWGDFTLAGKDSRNLKRYFLQLVRTPTNYTSLHLHGLCTGNS